MSRWIFVSLLVAGIAGMAAAQNNTNATNSGTRYTPESGNYSAVIQMYGAPGANDPVGTGDLIEVRVFNQDQMSGTARVANDGSIDLPFIGKVDVAGQTTPAIEKTLDNRYAQVLKDPVVSVRVIEVNSRHVAVTGLVERPGVYAYSGKITLLDALGMAGGVNQAYGANTIYLLHHSAPAMRTGSDGNSTISVNSVLETIDLDKVWKDPALNRIIQPGDTIQVPEAERVYVTGSVIHPGELQLRPGLTVAQAIGTSGGFIAQADHGSVKILRRAKTGTGRTELKVNIDDIHNNKRPDVPLLADDIVIVPSSLLRNSGLAVLDFFAGAGRWRIQQTAINQLP